MLSDDAAQQEATDSAQRRLQSCNPGTILAPAFPSRVTIWISEVFGNLLGDEQSGHVREVGIELYQTIARGAVASLRAGEERGHRGRLVAQINLGAAVLIPES